LEVEVIELLARGKPRTVWLLDGAEEWILLHIEVQHWPEPGFEKRLYRYNYRTMDVYGKPVATLVILADRDPHWRPMCYLMEIPGTRVRFDFSVCKQFAENPVCASFLSLEKTDGQAGGV
jgi:hypothetical protein